MIRGLLVTLVVLLLGLAAWAVGLRQERVRAKRIGTPRATL